MTFGVNTRPNAEQGPWRPSTHRVRRGPGTLYRKLQSLKFLVTRDRSAILSFLSAEYPFDFPWVARLELLRDYIRITNAVRGYHTLADMLRVSHEIFLRAGRTDLTVVEAGAGFGSSTAKLSLATRIAKGRLYVFDTFRGIPENDEAHQMLDGRPVRFRKGAFLGRLSAVERRVAELGAVEVCEFHKGLFEETLPHFDRRIDVVLQDVDLIASTRTCATRLVPLLKEDGILFSQDGHLKATVALFSDPKFWEDEVGVPVPVITGLGEDKLIALRPHPGGAATEDRD